MIILKKPLFGALILALLTLISCNSEKNASLFLGGDVFLARGGVQIFAEDANPWGELLAVRQQFGKGLFAVNLESMFGTLKQNLDQSKLAMNLCAPVSEVQKLQLVGINLVTTANNHIMDCASGAGITSKEVLGNAGIVSVSDQNDPIYQFVSDRTIAFFAIDDYAGSYDPDSISQSIQTAATISDLVVVSVHWGREFQAGATDEQMQLAAQLVDAGADIVWGHHPHVLQPIQWMRSAVDGHQALVMYSLGNLISDQWMLPDAQRTAVVKIDFNGQGIRQVSIIPLQMEMTSQNLALEMEQDKLDWWIERLKITELVGSEVEVVIYKRNTD